MKKNIFLIFILLAAFEIKAETLTMLADYWCPYTCSPESSRPGFMVEIAKEIFESEGLKVDYSIRNWARAVAETKVGKYNAVIGANVGDVEGFILPSEPQGIAVNYFWARKDSEFFYKEIASLKGKKIGVINGYSYGAKEIDLPIARHNSSFVIVPGEDALPKLLKMTEAKRIEGFIENPYVLGDLVSTSMKQFSGKFKPVSNNIVKEVGLYIAFSPTKHNSKKLAQTLSEGMNKIRKSGKLKKILDKYGIKDWK